jgi:hypothetical protein
VLHNRDYELHSCHHEVTDALLPAACCLLLSAITAAIMEVIAKHELREKLAMLVTDNAANMVVARRLVVDSDGFRHILEMRWVQDMPVIVHYVIVVVVYFVVVLIGFPVLCAAAHCLECED